LKDRFRKEEVHHGSSVPIEADPLSGSSGLWVMVIVQASVNVPFRAGMPEGKHVNLRQKASRHRTNGLNSTGACIQKILFGKFQPLEKV